MSWTPPKRILPPPAPPLPKKPPKFVNYSPEVHCSICRHFDYESNRCTCSASHHFGEKIECPETLRCERYKPKEKDFAAAHYPYCPECGAYIPVNRHRCLACGVGAVVHRSDSKRR